MQVTKQLPTSIEPVVQRIWHRLEQSESYQSSGLDKLLKSNSSLRDDFNKVLASSDYVADSIIADPALLVRLQAQLSSVVEKYQPLVELDQVLSKVEFDTIETSLPELKFHLRKFHRQQFIRIIWQDICGVLTLRQVCEHMSELADACLQASLDRLHDWTVRELGRPMGKGLEEDQHREQNQPQSMLVIGMGKLGARELNVSSDVDLIFAYPQTGQVDQSEALTPSQDGLSNQQFFTRLGQRLIDVIDSVTVDGFVFRVDMRLRPYGSEGALVLGFDAIEDYYQNQGRDWERYAFIKARIVAGNEDRGSQLLQRLNPFVYRRYLDFAMFDSLREMKKQINTQARRQKLESDIKLGRGGIREIEFIAQALQLVHGGKDRGLQTASLYEAMSHLAKEEYLPQTVVAALMSAYEYLRKLEHRLQILCNEQTQCLPVDALRQDRIAYGMGHKDWSELKQVLQQYRITVADHFMDIVDAAENEEDKEPLNENWSGIWAGYLDQNEAVKFLRSNGFVDPEAALQVLQEFRRDKKLLLLGVESRRRLDAFMPILLGAMANSKNPDLCLSRVMGLVEAVSRRTAYLVLLMENDTALNQLVQYFTESSFISEYLTRYPVLLDELLDVINHPPARSSLRDELEMQLVRINKNYFEQQLECLHYFKQSHILRVAAAEVAGNMPIMKVSDYLTFTAEVILEQVLAICWSQLVEKFGCPVHIDGNFGEADFAILGYGKMGGIELSYSSDLDLVFIHRAALDKDTQTDSDQQRSINSREFYIRLAQKIISMLGTYTLSGSLYEIDMRLRPSGESGLLVSSLESFAEYQDNKAWTWEHQALVRARGVAGNKDLINNFDDLRKRVLSLPRDIGELAADILSMRQRMRDELASKSTSDDDKLAFEIKQGRGGIVDIEFLVQFLVLAYSREYSGLMTFTDNFRILEAAQEGNLLSSKDVSDLIKAYLDLRSASHKLALEQEGVSSSFAELETHQLAVARIWDTVFADYVAEKTD